MQQGTQLLLQDHPTHLRQEDSTAHPQPLIPIYYIHDFPKPFCTNPACFCQRSKQDAIKLFRGIDQESFFLLEAASLLETGSTTTIPRRTRIHVDLIPGVPEDCQLYGHTWGITENRDVYECGVCHLFGYCPMCTPIAPNNAQPFTCSVHAGQGGRQ